MQLLIIAKVDCRRCDKVNLGGIQTLNRALIDSWLEGDLTAPPKQRHTARRVWQRLVEEQGAPVAETTVRDYVRARRREIGLPGQA